MASVAVDNSACKLWCASSFAAFELVFGTGTIDLARRCGSHWRGTAGRVSGDRLTPSLLVAEHGAASHQPLPRQRDERLLLSSSLPLRDGMDVTVLCTWQDTRFLIALSALMSQFSPLRVLRRQDERQQTRRRCSSGLWPPTVRIPMAPTMPAVTTPKYVKELFSPSTTGAVSFASSVKRCCCGDNKPRPTAPQTATATTEVPNPAPAQGSEANTNA